MNKIQEINFIIAGINLKLMWDGTHASVWDMNEDAWREGAYCVSLRDAFENIESLWDAAVNDDDTEEEVEEWDRIIAKVGNLVGDMEVADESK